MDINLEPSVTKQFSVGRYGFAKIGNDPYAKNDG